MANDRQRQRARSRKVPSNRVEGTHENSRRIHSFKSFGGTFETEYGQMERPRALWLTCAKQADDIFRDANRLHD